MDLMFAPLRRYADFEGRSRRTEYWLFRLFQLIVFVVLFGIAMTMGRAGGAVLLLYVLFAMAVLIPSIAVSVRRLHDTNRSGWWLLIALIPFGAFVILVFDCLEGDRGSNQYGPDPKGSPGDTIVAETFA
jgi:uncharacterized membrane protein YhaH (DUF805 family)